MRPVHRPSRSSLFLCLAIAFLLIAFAGFSTTLFIPLVVIARDWLTLGRVHPVYVWAGGAMVAVHLIELAAAESPLWVRAGRWMLGDAG